ncbi:MAG: 16S rRNA (cytidine(1402)-2'-O)-methyltransferase [Clostridium sp.]|uniref:16S rRNA (cytidine(1402)-2'-O)-methyltransferase n=1 Tax=Clostridium sp. TaxID=1506 RepID=UPI003028AF90
MSGKLYLIPTPIGNLKDITLRALETLKSVDVIACEDTRQSLKLLNHFQIKKTLISYHMHNENGKSEDIIKRLLEGQNIAIISDAGTPGISDPGAVIARKCIDEGIQFEVYPGATAITTALVYSGLDTNKFTFVGFLSRENKERKATMEGLMDRQETLILYEAPHRIQSTLSFIRESLGNRKIAVCKELTKLHETILRGTVDECIQYYNENQPRGEYVIVIAGKSNAEIMQEMRAQWENMTVEEHIKQYMGEGKDKKEAVKLVAKDRNLHKSEIYKYSINM